MIVVVVDPIDSVMDIVDWVFVTVRQQKVDEW